MFIAEIDNNVDIDEARLIFGRKGNKVVKNILVLLAEKKKKKKKKKKGRIVTNPKCLRSTIRY